MVRKDIAYLLAVAIIIKLLYFTMAVLYTHYTGNGDYDLSYGGYIQSLKKNDSYWYEQIAREGYPKISDRTELGFHDGEEFRQSAWAFFPLYPLLTALFSRIPGIDLNLSFLLLSYLFSLAGFIIFYLFLRDSLKDRKIAWWTTLLLMVFPFHYYFSMFYTEALFFTLLTGSFLSISKKKYILLSLMLAALVLIRPNGIIMLLPLYLYMLEREDIFQKRKLSWSDLMAKNNLIRTAWFASAPLVFMLYGFYQWKMTGEFFAFSIAQEGWYREPRFPLLSLFREGNLANQFDSVYTIAFMILAIIGWKKLPLSMNILIWLSLLLPLASGSVQSMPRFISTIFPFMIIMGIPLTKSRLRITGLAILLALQLFTYYFWLIDHPLSY